MGLWSWWRERNDDGGLPGGRGIPAPPRADRDVPELVELEVGYDRFTAGAVVARLEAEEIPVRLLTMDDHGLLAGRVALHPHRILVRADDQERVRRIVAQAS